MLVCPCPRTELCPDCYERALLWHIGAARARGYWWAQSVARKVGTSRPWPPYEGRCRDVALRKVADCSEDDRVREVLARACWAEAERAWVKVT